MLRFLSLSLAASLVIATGYLLPRADDRQQINSVVNIAVAAPLALDVQTEPAGGATNQASAAGAGGFVAKPMTELERRFAELNGLISPAAANNSGANGFAARNSILMPVALREPGALDHGSRGQLAGGFAAIDENASHSVVDGRIVNSAWQTEIAGAIADPVSTYELARNLQRELRRVGCYSGRIDGDWGGGSRGAMGRFNAQLGVDLPVGEPHQVLLSLVSKQDDRVCGAQCQRGTSPDSYGRCVRSNGNQIAARTNGDPQAGSNSEANLINPWATQVVQVPLTRATAPVSSNDYNRNSAQQRNIATSPSQFAGQNVGQYAGQYAGVNGVVSSTYNSDASGYSVNGISQVKRNQGLEREQSATKVRVIRPTLVGRDDRAQHAIRSRQHSALGKPPSLANAQKSYKRASASRSSNWTKSVFTPR